MDVIRIGYVDTDRNGKAVNLFRHVALATATCKLVRNTFKF